MKEKNGDGARKVFVALKMAVVAGQDKFSGIMRRLGAGLKWDLRIIRSKTELTADAVREALADGTDGFIVSIPGADDALDILARSSVPTVVMDIHKHPIVNRTRNVVFIRNDNAKIGREAAGFFLSQGVFRSFAYVPENDELAWSAEREASFRTELEDNGFRLNLWENGTKDRKGLGKWLKTLPAPVAVFAACDALAYDVLRACEAARLSVPRDAAVLGVDNDELVCRCAEPALSSVQPDFEGSGYTAADELECLMSGPANREPKTVRMDVKEIIRRDSTAPVSNAGRLVRKADAFIDRNACAGITVPDVVKHLRISRRLADLRFRELRGETILDAIRKRRLEEVRRLLVTTREPIKKITSDCGWGSVNYLKNLFKREYGMTLGGFRKAGGFRPKAASRRIYPL